MEESLFPSFGSRMLKDHFNFADGYLPLNHGSFGTCPDRVLEYQRALQLQTEARPDTFLRYTYPKLLDEARAAIAPLLGVQTQEVVFVPNATTGVNTVLRNLAYEEGDVLLYFNTIYGACLKTAESVGEITPLKARSIDIAYPISDDEIVRLFREAVTAVRAQGKNAKLAMFDTVLTFPGMRFPWEALVDTCRELGGHQLH
ncbi:hypothetical protein DL766_006566 [Monosporascus sp. MC13-8B]|uniref:Aminotransferase class V domain-containing protein n=1 Tax=Monosporascus cannonballus TaxID=155416 RepID=A0ABY0HD37_9PEZI|nr:hypothetical protein DL762_003026 [Monosporascus cannonballus]RYO95817.1 hypothetical protein DL763_003524 [Monosporascus cannonballus]RYP26925.1 hypothetical protein DL766_006566 [Monosporascus sp. MC13-8B]